MEQAASKLKMAAEKLGKDKKAEDKNWQAPPKPSTADAAPAPKPQPKDEKKPSAKKPAGKKPADNKPADE